MAQVNAENPLHNSGAPAHRIIYALENIALSETDKRSRRTNED
jgi:hypothetical protein